VRALSEAVAELDEILRNHSNGESLEILYDQIPDPLKGFVELFFDMEHNASYRLIEPLLYSSQYYKRELQSASFGLLSRVKERPFALSTPRLPDDNHLQLSLDYNSPMLEAMLAARTRALSGQQLAELIEGAVASGGLNIEELFTNEPPAKRHETLHEGVRLQYTGHAGFLIETPELAVMIDPVIASRGGAYANDVISFSELPDKIDYLCITHTHQDHANIESLLQLRYKTDTVLVPKNNGGTLADPSLKLLLKQLNFNVVEMDDMECLSVAGGNIRSIPFLGEHGDLFVRSKCAWYLELGQKKLFFGADSSNLDQHMYRHIHQEIGDIDILAIGMECIGAPYTWLYGALHTKRVSKQIKESRRLNGSNYQQASNIVKVLSPKQVYIYALGQEPWYRYFMGIDYSDDSEQIVQSRKMMDFCRDYGCNAEALFGKKIEELA